MRSQPPHEKERNTNQEVRSLLIFVLWICGISFLSCDTEWSSATITAEEFRFSPDLVKLPALQKVRLIVRNQGRERHVFHSPILARKNVLFDRESLPDQWRRGDGIPIPPGKWIELSLVLHEGVYPFRCQIRGHKGMEGALVVVK